MHSSVQLTSLILIVFLHFSCIDKNTTVGQTHKIGLDSSAKSDTLKFTSVIRAILQDSKGNYWFGSSQEGVAMFDGTSFTYFTSKEGLSSNQIHSIQEDMKGVIWFETPSGVSSYDGVRMTNHTTTSNEISLNVFPIQRNTSKTNEWKKTANDLWFGAGKKSGVYRYDGLQLEYLELPPQKVLDPNDNVFAVTGISEGKNTMIWFATYAGVFGYNGSDFTIITDETLGYDRTVAPLHIRSILEDSKGRLWIGNNGIGVLLKEGDSIVNFSEKHHLIHPNSKRNGKSTSPQGTLEHVFTIEEDSQGNIWFGDRDAGLWKYDGTQLTNYTTKDGFEHDFVLSIFEDRNKTLWFGMADGKIYTFNGKTFEKRF